MHDILRIVHGELDEHDIRIMRKHVPFKTQISKHGRSSRKSRIHVSDVIPSAETLSDIFIAELSPAILAACVESLCYRAAYIGYRCFLAALHLRYFCTDTSVVSKTHERASHHFIMRIFRCFGNSFAYRLHGCFRHIFGISARAAA